MIASEEDEEVVVDRIEGTKENRTARKKAGAAEKLRKY